MKTRWFLVALLVVALVAVSGVCFAEEADNELHYDRFFISLPAIDIREAPDKPGAIDTLYAGDEVDVITTDGIWAMFKYIKDGEEREGCTWVSAIAQAVRIHLLEDEFIFHIPVYDREDYGLLSTWREPTDPDLLILWEETSEIDGEKWYYVLSVEDCRAGYMRGTAAFEVVDK